jgi:hypothetical protein
MASSAAFAAGIVEGTRVALDRISEGYGDLCDMPVSDALRAVRAGMSQWRSVMNFYSRFQKAVDVAVGKGGDGEPDMA